MPESTHLSTSKFTSASCFQPNNLHMSEKIRNFVTKFQQTVTLLILNIL